MKVLSIDPSLRACGVVLLERNAQRWLLLHSTTVRTTAKQPDERRHDAICQAVISWVRSADLVVCEALERVFLGKQAIGKTDAKSLKNLAIVGDVRGIALSNARPFLTIDPQQWRASLGLPQGADKKQAKAILERIVSMPAGRISQDCFDAMAIGIAGERRWRMNGRRVA